jgi:hypothetical protein
MQADTGGDTTAASPSVDADAAKPAPDADATRLIPSSDADATQLVDAPDSMRPADTAGAGATPLADTADADATKPTPVADATRPIDGDTTRPIDAADLDATQVTPELAPPVDPYEPDEDENNAPTHVIRPPTPDPTAVMRPTPPAIRGSAPVYTGGTQRGAEPWTPEPPPDRRAWWLPILLGIVGLLVLVGVAYLLVHALNNSGSPQTPTTPAPVASTPTIVPSTPPTTPPSAPPSAPPSSLPPSSLAPSSVAPSAPPSSIIIPSTLTGLLFPDVDAELNSMGLKYKLEPQINNDPSVIPNTVLSISPAAGTTVSPGTTVTVFYAQRSPTASPSSPSPQ